MKNQHFQKVFFGLCTHVTFIIIDGLQSYFQERKAFSRVQTRYLKKQPFQAKKNILCSQISENKDPQLPF